MPRAKIRPEDRQRAYKACNSCKALKKRCDSQVPCAMCVRRNCASTCVYLPPTDRRRLTSSTMPPHSTQEQRMMDRTTPSPEECETENGASPTMSFETENLSSSAPQNTEPRMLLSSKGERVYIGGTASLSFLHFLRQVLRQQMGPSPFTENERRHYMLEVNADSVGSEPLELGPGDMNMLIDCYFAVTSGIFYLFSREEVAEMQRRTVSDTRPDRGEAAVVSLAIAIGAQCRGAGRSDQICASQYFAKGQQFAFEGMLQDPSLNMIRLFLQMAFYMLGACRRNTAFMYIGVASKAASALGLHATERQCHSSEKDRSRRIRIWKSLRILDLLVTAILGRPCETSLMGSDSGATRAPTGDADIQSRAFDATFDACVLLETMMQDLGKTPRVDADYAELFLQRLGTWSASLPKELREFNNTRSPVDAMSQELVIGSVHNACVYYFAIMLITRPFLISHLTSRFASRTQLNDNLERNEQDGRRHASLANACIDSAIFMVQICHDALRSGLLLRNMCMLKAWIFAAGLCLGFAIFAEGKPAWEKEVVFTKAREILHELSHLSPQAAHYHEILSAFVDAIERHRHELSRRHRGSSTQFVNEIFTLNLTEPNSELQYATPSSRGTGSLETGGQGSHFHVEVNSTAPPINLGNDFDIYDWDEFSMQLPEGFTFDMEPAGLFFDTTQ